MTTNIRTTDEQRLKSEHTQTMLIDYESNGNIGSIPSTVHQVATRRCNVEDNQWETTIKRNNDFISLRLKHECQSEKVTGIKIDSFSSFPPPPPRRSEGRTRKEEEDEEGES